MRSMMVRKWKISIWKRKNWTDRSQAGVFNIDVQLNWLINVQSTSLLLIMWAETAHSFLRNRWVCCSFQLQNVRTLLVMLHCNMKFDTHTHTPVERETGREGRKFNNGYYINWNFEKNSFFAVLSDGVLTVFEMKIAICCSCCCCIRERRVVRVGRIIMYWYLIVGHMSNMKFKYFIMISIHRHVNENSKQINEYGWCKWTSGLSKKKKVEMKTNNSVQIKQRKTIVWAVWLSAGKYFKNKFVKIFWLCPEKCVSPLLDWFIEYDLLERTKIQILFDRRENAVSAAP